MSLVASVGRSTAAAHRCTTAVAFPRCWIPLTGGKHEMMQKLVNIHSRMCEPASEPCNTERWQLEIRTDGHTAGEALPGLTAGVQTLHWCPSRSQVTSTGGHSQVARHKVSHVHVVRVWRAGRLGLFLGLPPRFSPYKPVVVLQLLLPLLLVVHLLRASSLEEKKIKMSTAHRLYSTTSETREGDFALRLRSMSSADELDEKKSPLVLVLANNYQVNFTQILYTFSNHLNH